MRFGRKNKDFFRKKINVYIYYNNSKNGVLIFLMVVLVSLYIFCKL